MVVRVPGTQMVFGSSQRVRLVEAAAAVSASVVITSRLRLHVGRRAGTGTTPLRFFN